MSDTNQPGQTGTGTGSPAGDSKPDTSFDPSKFVAVETFNGTAATIRRLNQSVEEMSKRKYLSIDDLVTAGLLELDDEGKPRAKSAAQATGKTGNGGAPDQLGDDHPAMKRVKALETQLETERQEKRKAAETTAALERKTAVVSALGKANALNADRDYIHLANQVVKNDAGAFVVKAKDEYGSEVEIPLEKFVTENFAKGNPELFRSTAQGGSGAAARGSQGGGNAGGGKVIPYEQWSTDMGFMMANQAKFASGEYVRGPKP